MDGKRKQMFSENVDSDTMVIMRGVTDYVILTASLEEKVVSYNSDDRFDISFGVFRDETGCEMLSVGINDKRRVISLSVSSRLHFNVSAGVTPDKKE